ncbi:MAG: SpoIIE family protein phosphatase [Planctomycetes bacterium]|nr:SpoIIE family protein phosphatase [Planctomycetota bacterium]
MPIAGSPGASPGSSREVIVVHEDESVLAVLTAELREAGFVPHPRTSVEAAFETLLDPRPWWAMVIDHGFRGPEATGFLDRLKAEPRAVPVVLSAWDENVARAPRVASYPWIRVLKQPFHPRAILAALNSAPPPPSGADRQRATTKSLIIHQPAGILKPFVKQERSAILPGAAREPAPAAPPVRDAKTAHEMERAREIQGRLLPSSLPQPEGFEIAGLYLPAEDVGGDYYDVITLPDGRIAMLVADVSGKGISAAMVMVMARTVFHSVAPGCTTARQLVLAAADRIARDLPGGIFISLVAAVLKPSSGEISIVNCGHMPPLHWSLIDGKPFVMTLDVSGGAIGLVKGAIFERTLRDATLVLGPGEQLVFYTDGVNEAMDEKNEEYGDKKLHKMLKTNGEAPAADLVQSIVDSVLYHRGDAPASDDITVLAVRRK